MKLLLKGFLHCQYKLEQFGRNEKGQAMSEYAIILGVVAVLIIATLVLFRNALVGLFTRIINAINGVGA
jgi:pilus assembly protein Flp/PilA